MNGAAKNPIILSESWRHDVETDELIDLRANPSERHPTSSYCAKVRVYESRVREWFLNIAQDSVHQGESPADYLALSISLAYIEGIEQYRQGQSTPNGKSRKWFMESAIRIFPAASPEALQRLWNDCRCGLFHSGFTDGRTYVSHGYEQPLAIVGGELEVNPRLIVEAVCEDFSRYIDLLKHRTDTALCANFEKLWDYRWENS